MTRLWSRLCRAALAGVVLLLVLAVSRWGPVYAEPPLDVRALPVAGIAVLLAVLAGFTGGERPGFPLRPIAWALLTAVAALLAVVALRPPAGLLLRADGPGSTLFLPHTGLDVSGRD